MVRFRNMPKSPVGEHLGDGEFDSYVAGRLGPHEVDRLDVHLESCQDCTIALERWIEGAQADSEAVREFTEMLGDEDEDVRFLARAALEMIGSVVDRRPPPRVIPTFDSREILSSDGALSESPLGTEVMSLVSVFAKSENGARRSRDGRLGYAYMVDKDDVILRVDSEVLKEGNYVLKAGELRKVLTLRLLDDGEGRLVEGEVVFTKKEWDGIPPEVDAMRIEPLPDRPSDQQFSTGADRTQ
jgi:hypothetical protein